MEPTRLSGILAEGSSNDASPDPSGDMIDVSLEPDAPAHEDPGQPKESVNLLDVLDDGEVGKMQLRAMEDYEAAVESRQEHMRDLRRWYELYASVIKAKSWPFQGAANVNEPLLTYSVLQVHGRLFDMILPSKGNLFNSLPTRAADSQELDRAERTELFLNWYLREKVPELRMSYDATLWQLIIFGSTFRRSYWDESQRRICPEWIGVDDMVVPFSCKVVDPNMRGVPHYTLRLHMNVFDIEDKIEDGYYTENARNKIKAGNAVKKDKSEFKEAVARVDGVQESNSTTPSDDEERIVLEQYRKVRLPKDPGRHPSFDGKAHPVVITIDESTRTVLRVVLREEDDPTDKKRHDAETAAFQQAQQANDAHAQNGGQQADPQTGALQPMAPPPPMPPEPTPIRQREICMFTHYQCFQGEGFYGLGFGNFIGPLNEAQNTLINQQIDRSTVNNAGGGIVSRQIRFQRGPIDRQPGQYTEVDAPPGAMKDGIQNWPMVPADPDGRYFLQHISEMSGRISGAGDTLSGEPVGSNETARAAMARFEQAQKQISVLASRVIGYLTCDIRIIWRLFSVFLDEQEYHDAVDSMGKPRSVQIGRADFIADARVQPTADARLTSRAQRIGEAQDFFQFVMTTPALQANPQVQRQAIEKVLYAMDQHEVIDMLDPVPPPPPPPIPQWQENAGFLREQDQHVNPKDDDDAHLLEMQLFDQDPLGAPMLSPTAQKMYENHRRFHYAAKLEKEHQANAAQQQQPPLSGPSGNGPPGLAPPAADGSAGAVPVQ